MFNELFKSILTVSEALYAADVLFEPTFEVKHFSNLKLVEDSKLVEELFEKVELYRDSNIYKYIVTAIIHVYTYIDIYACVYLIN